MELLSEPDWEEIIHRQRDRGENGLKWSEEKRKENWWEEGGINTTGAPGPYQMKIQFQKKKKEGLWSLWGEEKEEERVGTKEGEEEEEEEEKKQIKRGAKK